MQKFNTFSYPARILSQNENIVTISISVDGREVLLNSPLDRFGFEVREDMRIMVDGILSGGKKSLEFRKIKPLTLDAEHEEMLVDLLAPFKSI